MTILLLLMLPRNVFAGSASPISLSLMPAAHGRGGAPVYESEHHPVPVRSYRVNGCDISSDAKAYVLHPDCRLDRIELKKTGQVISLSFKTHFGDGPMHGVHNAYVVDTTVSDGTRIVRVAKWMTIHHNCGWGHGYRFDKERTGPKQSGSIPLEISCTGLWDGNWHTSARSGDPLTFTVYFFGKPVAGAGIRLQTGQGWGKSLETDASGSASFQLIREYYPGKWPLFNRDNRTPFTATAEYRTVESGEFSGQAYRKTHYITTLPWTYTPSPKDYSSLQTGLLTGVLVLALSAAGVYAFRARRKRPYQEIMIHEKNKPFHQ